MTALNKSADSPERGISELAAAVSAVADIKRAVAADLRESPHSRESVALMLSDMCGRRISEAQIDAWAAESKEHRFPADLVGAWVRVTGSARILRLLCEGAGLHMATDTDRELAEFGRVVIERERHAEKFDALRGKLWHKV